VFWELWVRGGHASQPGLGLSWLRSMGGVDEPHGDLGLTRGVGGWEKREQTS